MPKQCCKHPTPVAAKKEFLEGDPAASNRPSFKTVWLRGTDRTWKVFVTDGETDDRSRQPVLLLHEIPALSPGALQLAKRLSETGKYRVYVPLLFGGEFDNNNSGLLRVWRPLEMSFFRPSWNALGSGERKITHELSGLCRTILKNHDKNARLGVIGMCITGALPLQLLAEKKPLPQIRAVVLSQPTMPVLTCTAAQKQSLGISDEELKRAKVHVQSANLHILGFRFQLDAVSPMERFERLHHEFGSRFLDRTLLAREYVFRDGMAPEAHAVLTDGFCKTKKGPPHTSAGEKAYAQLRDYLEQTLTP